MSEKRILLAEDEPVLRELMVVELEEHGCTVHVARDGEEAIDLLKNEEQFGC